MYIHPPIYAYIYIYIYIHTTGQTRVPEAEPSLGSPGQVRAQAREPPPHAAVGGQGLQEGLATGEKMPDWGENTETKQEKHRIYK